MKKADHKVLKSQTENLVYSISKTEEKLAQAISSIKETTKKSNLTKQSSWRATISMQHIKY